MNTHMGELPFERIKRTTLVRKDITALHTLRKKNDHPPLKELLEKGIVIIDKPAGPTSHQVAEFAKNILHTSKAGHSGTLDPGVTGVLAVSLGKATRVSLALLQSGKEYVCEMHLHKEFPEDVIRKTLAKFVGKIKQMPPVKSAVKRQWRLRRIYYIDVLEIKGQDVLFRVGCQAGTYIRKLCHDIGESLGCGAHMAELRRTKAGAFQEKDSVTLHDLADAYHYATKGDETRLRDMIHPLEAGVMHLPRIWIFDGAIDAVCHGVPLMFPGIVKAESDIQKDEMVAVMSLADELVLVGESFATSRELVEKNKGIALKTQQVFMSLTDAGSHLTEPRKARNTTFDHKKNKKK